MFCDYFKTSKVWQTDAVLGEVRKRVGKLVSGKVNDIISATEL